MKIAYWTIIDLYRIIVEKGNEKNLRVHRETAENEREYELYSRAVNSQTFLASKSAKKTKINAENGKWKMENKNEEKSAKKKQDEKNAREREKQNHRREKELIARKGMLGKNQNKWRISI